MPDSENTVPLITPYFPEYAVGGETGLRALLGGTASALLGGTNAYLLPAEPWPRCKTCGNALLPYLQINVAAETTPGAFRARIPPLREPGAGATLFQVFVCVAETDDGSCFEGWMLCTTEGDSWLVRTVPVDVGVDVGKLERALAAHGEVRDALAQEALFVPERVIARWNAGNPETMHDEVVWDYDDAYYAAHEPAEGLKLLGYPTLGKYQSRPIYSDGQCAAGDDGPHPDFSCLIQLGTRDEDNPLYTVGNTFIDQCDKHRDVFEPVCAGTW
ncbi:hypothetical protein BD413DRAFT_483183 [Trametes elegans]|nr:hypothetical protein BD413DRAFT_483183 [Trametes elegans]